jgi:prepilin-type N-terminal cleavage/methylation domain-containing protein
MSRVRARVRPGFTLLELTMVLVVVGLVASIGMPRIDLTRVRMDSGFRQVGITMLKAQRTAIMRQHAVIVAFDTTGRRLRVHEDQNNDGVMQGGEPVEFLALEDGVFFGRGSAPALPMGVGPISFARRQAGLPAVTFLRSGGATESGGLYLTSLRAIGAPRYADDARAFTVSRATGRVFQFQYAGGAWRRRF